METELKDYLYPGKKKLLYLPRCKKTSFLKKKIILLNFLNKTINRQGEFSQSYYFS